MIMFKIVVIPKGGGDMFPTLADYFELVVFQILLTWPLIIGRQWSRRHPFIMVKTDN